MGDWNGLAGYRGTLRPDGPRALYLCDADGAWVPQQKWTLSCALLPPPAQIITSLTPGDGTPTTRPQPAHASPSCICTHWAYSGIARIARIALL
eukprot:COSAG05_NODE_405_length_10177_cov_2.310776_6_plen_94_part_00